MCDLWYWLYTTVQQTFAIVMIFGNMSLCDVALTIQYVINIIFTAVCFCEFCCVCCWTHLLWFLHESHSNIDKLPEHKLLWTWYQHIHCQSILSIFFGDGSFWAFLVIFLFFLTSKILFHLSAPSKNPVELCFNIVYNNIQCNIIIQVTEKCLVASPSGLKAVIAQYLEIDCDLNTSMFHLQPHVNHLLFLQLMCNKLRIPYLIWRLK